MPHSDLMRNIEALLFVADSPLSVAELVRILESDEPSVIEALQQLEAALCEHGLRVQRNGTIVQLTTAPECSAVVEQYLGVETIGKLSAAAMETLAIIAYRQPVTRAVIEALRGVNCEGALHSLISRSLVTPAGRLESVGRPVLYATTPEFLQYLGINNLSELPPMPEAVSLDL